MKIGYYHTPFTLIPNHYTIIPDYSFFSNSRKTTYQITDSIIQVLHGLYPKMAQVIVSKNMRGFSVEHLSATEKEQLFRKLRADKGVGFIAQLFTIGERQALTYLNNQVFVELKTNQPDSLKKAALAIGFSDMRAEMGNNRYVLTYQSKMIDEDFFEAFRKLTELPGVMGVYFNHYYEHEPDGERVAGTSNFHRRERE